MSHELPSNLRLRKVGNIRKMLKLHRIIALRSILNPPPPENENSASTSKSPKKIEIEPPQQLAISPENQSLSRIFCE